MKEFSYVIWQEDKYYVSQCLNIDVSSFGETFEEAVKNLKEAVQLYFDGEDVTPEMVEVKNIVVGKGFVNA
ncbi:MAG: type II toxin-antitoxin system HicB family antitoxin [Candidatus Wallbacteria bacterium]|nr:type II toxin-antitoxin system HicB family antitoxin [Candidatus Wallbacteria bacterium]